MSHLLFFDGVARKCEGVAAARKDEAGDASVHGSEKGQLAYFEGDEHIAAAEFDAIGGNDLICGRGIDAEGVECIVKLVGRCFG
jgi:hypothetical protein